ncbi:MAG: methionine adenosyltransferase [Candidatus Latescibacteria bacterium]|nr:methionine adenosyltransferase [Candidatus Latescibacterota bacterium]
MFIRDGVFTSESVSEGHPDKLADRISDALVDAFLELDPAARVACETLLADQHVVVAGEFRTERDEDFDAVSARAKELTRAVIRDTGYADADSGIDPDNCFIDVRFNRQASEITAAVKGAQGAQGAGDQGLMFGYACDETGVLMPAPIVDAHRLMQKQAEVRRCGTLPWLSPDAKSQVSYRYEDGRPVAVEAVVLSTQHDPGIGLAELQAQVREHIIDPVIPAARRSAGYREYINPSGSFTVGGPKGDTGLTGRKIIVDTYGGAAPHGGGAFSGKDPSKVDRSAAYMTRFLAKTVVARGWAGKCLVQLAYAIGEAEPVSFLVMTPAAGRTRDAEIAAALRAEFDLTPAGIIERLRLLRPIYFDTAAYGHFGREKPDFLWEHVTTDN